MIRLECKDAQHDKFWEASVSGSTLTVRFGRIGTDGQTKAKKLATPDAAKTELEKLIREKLGKGYVTARGGAKPAANAKAKPAKAKPAKAKRGAQGSGPKSAALLALASLLAPKSAKVAARVALALDAPEAYKKKFAEDLEDRNAEDDPVDPWLALVSALTDERTQLACSLDWKFAAEDIEANLAWVIAAQAKLRGDTRLYDKKKLFAFYDEDQHLRTKTLDFIALCGRAFSAHGLALVELDLASDSYELTLLPWKDLGAAQSLATKAGGELILHGPKKPLASPLPAPLPPAKPGGAKLDKRKLPWEVSSRDFYQYPGVRHLNDSSPKTTVTSLFDCRVWPPAKSVIAKGNVRFVVHVGDGSRIVHRVEYDVDENEKVAPRPTGMLRIERPKKPAIDLLDRLPDGFEIEHAAWIGDLAVLFPSGATVQETKSRRPLVWDGKTLAAAKGLPDAGRSSSWLRGHARTGDGVDVVLWECAGWIAKGDRFVKAWTLPKGVSKYEEVVGAPAPGNGFFYMQHVYEKKEQVTMLRHAENGKCSARVRLPRVDAPPRTAMDGRVLLGLNRSEEPKSPALAVFHPATDELTLVPAQLLGLRKDHPVEAYGVSTPTKGGAFLWVLDVDDEEVRRIAWDAILALPRVPAR
jgi:predicted DNA-binding WGR domain protein